MNTNSTHSFIAFCVTCWLVHEKEFSTREEAELHLRGHCALHNLDVGLEQLHHPFYVENKDGWQETMLNVFAGNFEGRIGDIPYGNMDSTIVVKSPHRVIGRIC